MGACTTCTNKNSFESIYKDFWAGVKIRAMPQKDWAVLAKNKNDPKLRKINQAKWELIIKDNLYWEENREISSVVFRKAMEHAEETGGQYLLVLSLLFLCPKNSLNTKQHFEDLAKSVFQMKDEFKEENHILYMKRERLFAIVSFYVNLISHFCADKLSVIAPTKKDFEDAMTGLYSSDVQEAFLKYEIFQGAKEEWINLDGFFEMMYPSLQDDGNVRERLSYFYDKKIKGQLTNKDKEKTENKKK